MRLKNFLKETDDGLYREEISEGNTWLYVQNPLFENVYYPLTGRLTEDELSHFSMLNEITREEKARRKEQAAEYKAARDINPEDNQSEVDKEVMKAVADLNKKSRKAFSQLDSLAKKSFIAKYILHGAGQKRTQDAQWGRMKRAPGQSTRARTKGRREEINCYDGKI
jgi:hypothetical protein